MIDSVNFFLYLGFFVLGLFAGRLGRKKAVPAGPPQPICGCRHGLHAHDPKTGVCHERVQLNNWDEKTKWGDCKCRQYTGPRPIDQIWIPEVLPPNSSSD